MRRPRPAFALAIPATLALVALIAALGTAQDSNRIRPVTPAVRQHASVIAPTNTGFATALYREIAKEHENFVISPWSVTRCSALALAGARGDTQAAMLRTLGLGEDAELVHPALAYLDTQMRSRSRDGYMLRTADSLWPDHTLDLKADYIDTLADNYGIELQPLDLRQDAQGSADRINRWVAGQTNDRITDLLSARDLQPAPRMVLTNAVYLDAKWDNLEFRRRNTRPMPFSLLDGEQAQVQMMVASESLRYARSNGWQAVTLPYAGGPLAMTVILPDLGAFEAVEESLSQELLAEIAAESTRCTVDLQLPRFTIRTAQSLGDVLQTMGMGVAFAEGADFRGMADEDLLISKVLQQAFIKVNEEGTEAAAATAMTMAPGSAMPRRERRIRMTVDRPFLYVIRHVQDGTVLFIGRVMNPAIIDE